MFPTPQPRCKGGAISITLDGNVMTVSSWYQSPNGTYIAARRDTAAVSLGSHACFTIAMDSLCLPFFSLVNASVLLCMSYLSYPARWIIALSALLTAVVVVWPQSLCLARMKNRHGHWLCWMSTSRKNGLMWRTHTMHADVVRSLMCRSFVTTELVSLGGRIGTDAGCAACGRVERTV